MTAVTAPPLHRRRGASVNRTAGASLLEFAVVLCIFATLAYFLLASIAYVQEQAEKTTFEQTLAHLETALELEARSREARGDLKALARIGEENPFDWLDSRPSNYAGALDTVTPGSGKPGYWLYDRKERAVVYTPKRSDHLRVLSEVPGEIRLRVSAGRQVDSHHPKPTGFMPVARYQWF